MDRSAQKLHANGANGKSRDHLAPYRRLVELQQQLVTAAEKNEKARRECAALQERIAAELISQPKPSNALGQKLRQKATHLLERLSRLTRN